MDAEAKRYHGNGSKHASTGLLEGNHSKVLNRKKGEFQWERVPQKCTRWMERVSRSVLASSSSVSAGKVQCFTFATLKLRLVGWTTLEHHQHEHVVVVLRGEGEIQLGLESYVLGMGDVGYTAPGDTHQLRCKVGAKEPFGFICVVAADATDLLEMSRLNFSKCAKWPTS